MIVKETGSMIMNRKGGGTWITRQENSLPGAEKNWD